MADVITRLKVESSEYDNKLKRATQSLSAMGNQARVTGNKISVLNNDNIALARSLGNMQTVAHTAKGRIGELNNAFTEASLVYKRLTDEEKQSPFGKELAKSVETLKGRLNDAKSELASVTGETQKGSNALSGLADKFGLNITQLTKFASATAVVTTALKVAKDAFLSSEANVDEWGRIVESAESTYQSFLNSINTGDISGFLSRIDEICNAARQAYDELDRLGTMKTINSPRLNAQKTENERFRAMLRTGRYIAPNDGRQATMKEGQVLTKEQKEKIAQQLQNGLKGVNDIIRSEIHQTTKSIEALYNRQSKELGMSNKEFKAGTANMAAFDERIAGYGKYKQWETGKQHAIEKAKTGNASQAELSKYSGKNPYEQYKAWGEFRVDGDRYKEIVDLITQRSGLQSQNYSETAQAFRSINTATGGGKSGGGKSGGSGGTDKLAEAIAKAQQQFNGGVNWMEGAPELDEYTQKVERLKELYSAAGIAEEGFGESLLPAFETDSIDYYTERIKKLTDLLGVLTIGSDDYNDCLQRINETQKKLDLKKANALEKAGDGTKVSWQGAAQAVSGLGGALQSINDPMANVMGIVAEAIANVASGLMSAFAKDSTMGIWGKIAAGISATATMISMIQSIHSATGYANGGIVRAANGAWVPGNSMSGDMVPALLNSGELVLNKAQVGNLASQLGDGGVMKNLRLETTIREDKLVVMLNNGLRKRGKGTLVTSR